MKEPKSKCVLCGGSSPNRYGECSCSYDPVFFSGDYKAIAKELASQVKTLQMLLRMF
jgi:hypothetical protein